MPIEVRPATVFDDVAAILGPRNPAASVCWCLSHRLDGRTNGALVGPARAEYVRELTNRPVAPGVLAYDDDVVVGWAAVAPRSELPFEQAGFTKAADTDSVAGGFRRVLMRRLLG